MSIHRYDMTVTTIGNPQAEADVRAIHELWKQIKDDQTPIDIETARMLMAGLDYHVKRVGSQVVGAVSVLDCKDNLVKIDSLAVDPAHQASGYGTQLVETVVTDAFDKGSERIITFAAPPSQKIFSRLGFEAIAYDPTTKNKTMMLE